MYITKRKYPWVGEQSWEDVLFLHWSAPSEVICPLIPTPFILDTYDGNAWITIAVFKAKNSLLRGMPLWTSFPPVTQINVRTYVYHPENREQGVYFFALRVNSLLASIGARALFGLPFYNVQNSFNKKGTKVTVTSSTEGSCVFAAQYEPKEKLVHNGLAEFLTERYCIWNVHRDKIIKIPIRHRHWKLAEVDISLKNKKLLSFLDEADYASNFIAHYSPYKHAMLYPYEMYGFYG